MSKIPIRTWFYRNPQQLKLVFDLAEQNFDPKNMITIGSLGCSVGCEPVSIAIEAKKRNLLDKTKVMAFDNDPDCINMAQNGLFSAIYFEPQTEGHVPDKTLLDYFERTTDNKYAPLKELTEPVKYIDQNILEPDFALQHNELFDVVFCQNVAAFLVPHENERLFLNLYRILKPGGILALGGEPAQIILSNIDLQKFSPVTKNHVEIYNGWIAQRNVWSERPRPVFALPPIECLKDKKIHAAVSVYIKKKTP